MRRPLLGPRTFLAASLFVFPTPSLASDSAVAFGGELDGNSRYVWRGIAWSEGPVLQPSAWVSAFDFTVSAWSNFVLTRETNQGQFNEVDLGLDWRGAWGRLTFEPSACACFYPNQADAPATLELAARLSYPVGPLSLFTSHAVEVMSCAGAYFGEAGFCLEKELVSVLSLSTTLTVGWASSRFNDAFLGLERNALNVAGAELNLTYCPWEGVYVAPHLDFSALLDRALRARVDDPTILAGGLALGVEF